MKEATGELNMTLVTIIAIAAVLGFVTFFLPGILDTIGGKWQDANDTVCTTDSTGTSCTNRTDKVGHRTTNQPSNGS